MQEQTPMHQVDDRTSVPKHIRPLSFFHDVKKVKSVSRAMRRGRMDERGRLYPSRPFNNAKRTKGRKQQQEFEKANSEVKKYLAKAREIDERNAG